MAALWDRLAAIYGHRWTSQHGDSHLARDTWQRGLADLSRKELGTGLRALLSRADPWPPSLPEFRQLCRPPAPEPAHTRYIALPRPASHPQRVADVLKAIKTRLNPEHPPC